MVIDTPYGYLTFSLVIAQRNDFFAERYIVSKEQNTFLRDDGAEITIDCICVENIAEKQKIEVDNQILPLD